METTAPQRGRFAALFYLFIAYGWTWLLWIPPLLAAQPHDLSMLITNDFYRLAMDGFAGDQHVLLVLMSILAVYGPLIGAVVATHLEQGREGVRALLRSTVNARIAPRWYGVALMLAGAFLLPDLLAALAGGLGQLQLPLSRRLLLFVPLLLLQILTNGLGEEPGWRGFLLPWLQKRFPPKRAVWLLGLAWSTWYHPLSIFLFQQLLPEDIHPLFAIVGVILVLAGQTLNWIAMSYLYVWLFNRTRSVFLMIFFHALTMTLPLMAPGVVGIWSLVVSVFPWVVVLALRRILGKPLV